MRKKAFFKISQNSQESTCVRLCNFIKKKPWHRCFMRICEISKNTVFTEHLRMTAFGNSDSTFICQISGKHQQQNYFSVTSQTLILQLYQIWPIAVNCWKLFEIFRTFLFQITCLKLFESSSKS